MNKIVQFYWSKTAKQFSINSQGKFLVSIRQAGKQAVGL